MIMSGMNLQPFLKNLKRDASHRELQDQLWSTCCTCCILTSRGPEILWGVKSHAGEPEHCVLRRNSTQLRLPEMIFILLPVIPRAMSWRFIYRVIRSCHSWRHHFVALKFHSSEARTKAVRSKVTRNKLYHRIGIQVLK